MAFIKVPLDYHSLPKVRRYVQLSGDHMAVLPIHAALLAAKEVPRSGRLLIPSPDALERRLLWEGEAGRGVDAMVKAGMMEKIEDGYRFLGWDTGWEDEQGHILKFHQRAQKAAKALWERSTVDATSSA